jgi:hypothetical protein
MRRRLATRGALRVWRRSRTRGKVTREGMRRAGRVEAEVVEDLPRHRRLSDEGDEAQPSCALGQASTSTSNTFWRRVAQGTR